MQQPVDVSLQLMLVASFLLYVALCVIENLIPKCSLWVYISTGLFILLSLGLTFAAAWMQWKNNAKSRTDQDQQDSTNAATAVQSATVPTTAAPAPEGATVIIISPAAPAADGPSSSPFQLAQPNCQELADARPIPPPTPTPAPSPALDFTSIEWTPRRLLYWPPLMVIIGAISGLLGMSPGGVFLTPMWLRMGQHPQVTSATVKLLLFTSTGSSAIGYLLNGQLNITYALIFGITNLLFTPLGQWAMDVWIARSGAPSLLVMSNIVRNVIGVVLIVAFNGVPGIQDLINGTNVGFVTSGLCG